jgi:hypothetical protein
MVFETQARKPLTASRLPVIFADHMPSLPASNLIHIQSAWANCSWIIPKPGTRTRQIYDLLIEGKTSSEIRAIIGGSVNSIGVLVHKIRQG